VTGDDLGECRAVNEAVFAAHESGILTSTSLIVTGQAVGDAVERARGRPRLSTGLHLVLCDGAPASDPAAIPGLVGPDGRFPASAARAGWRLWTGRRSLRAQLERELRAQLERYLETGLPLDHVDGHHHLHMHPVVFEVLVRLLEELKVPWLRLVQEDGAGRAAGTRGPRGELESAIFGALARRHRERLSRGGVVASAARLYGLRATGHMDEAAWLALIPLLRTPVVEVFCHPRRDCEAGQREEAALRSPAVRAAIREAGYELATSRSLGRGALGAAA
jgi:hopanoid biosynthesis associated protein HpnK